MYTVYCVVVEIIGSSSWLVALNVALLSHFCLLALSVCMSLTHVYPVQLLDSVSEKFILVHRQKYISFTSMARYDGHANTKFGQLIRRVSVRVFFFFIRLCY